MTKRELHKRIQEFCKDTGCVIPKDREEILVMFANQCLIDDAPWLMVGENGISCNTDKLNEVGDMLFIEASKESGRDLFMMLTNIVAHFCAYGGPQALDEFVQFVYNIVKKMKEEADDQTHEPAPATDKISS